MNTQTLKYISGFSWLAIMALLTIALIAGQARGSENVTAANDDGRRHSVNINLILRLDQKPDVQVEHSFPE